jgi:membrane fusion protein (multidrug efflux system)
MKTFKLTILLLGLAITGILQGCGIGEASNPSSDEVQAAMAVPVEVALPSRMDVYATYHATSTISSDADAPVLARVPGQVVQLLVEEGDAVEKGQVLARLDGEKLRLEMLAAEANLEQAQRELARYTDLAGRGLVSASMFDGLRYDVDAFEATYKLKKLNYGYSQIRAPIAGVVASRNIKPGQTISINTVAYRITDTRELVAYLQIPQAELAKISAGHEATLRVDSMPETDFSASIVRISPTIDVRNGTFRATLHVDNRRGDLAPGMFARFEIFYEKHESALVVPAGAIVEEDGETTVYVVADGKVSRRSVEAGIAADGRIEILSGLADDDEIVVLGHAGLRDGSKVLASNRVPDSYSG